MGVCVGGWAVDTNLYRQKKFCWLPIIKLAVSIYRAAFDVDKAVGPDLQASQEIKSRPKTKAQGPTRPAVPHHPSQPVASSGCACNFRCFRPSVHRRLFVEVSFFSQEGFSFRFMMWFTPAANRSTTTQPPHQPFSHPHNLSVCLWRICERLC